MIWQRGPFPNNAYKILLEHSMMKFYIFIDSLEPAEYYCDFGFLIWSCYTRKLLPPHIVEATLSLSVLLSLVVLGSAQLCCRD